MRNALLMMGLCLWVVTSVSKAESTCAFAITRDGYVKMQGIDIPKRFERRQFVRKITSAAPLSQQQIVIKIKETILKKAETDFDELANLAVEGIKEVLIPITVKEKGTYGLVTFRYVEDHWGSSPGNDWIQHDYYLNESSLSCN